MSNRLQGKVAVITGVSKGLGAAFAQRGERGGAIGGGGIGGGFRGAF